MNPFFQWNSQSRNPGDWPNSSQGPTYGALPNLQSLPYSMTFNFIMSNSSILNCSVTGTNSLTYLYVSTNATSTTLTRRNGEVCGTITWGQHAIVEARGKIERQRTSEWLRLTTDRRLVHHYLPEIDRQLIKWSLIFIVVEPCKLGVELIRGSLGKTPYVYVHLLCLDCTNL